LLVEGHEEEIVVVIDVHLDLSWNRDLTSTFRERQLALPSRKEGPVSRGGFQNDTYIRLELEFVYLAVILALFHRG
jgi:hypothetical protein